MHPLNLLSQALSLMRLNSIRMCCCKLKTRGAAAMDIKPIVVVAILKIRRSPSYV